MKQIFTVAALTAVVVLSSGCASVPKGSAKIDEQARAFTPPPGKANLYVIRTGNAGYAVIWDIGLDWQTFGSLAVDTYLFAVVSPGEHTLRSTTPTTVLGATSLVTEAGKNYFYRATLRFGGGYYLNPIDEETGRKLLAKCTLSGDSVVEHKGVER